MRKAVFKDFIRNIKGSLGRFFAIMAIVAIGVAFFVFLLSVIPLIGWYRNLCVILYPFPACYR